MSLAPHLEGLRDQAEVRLGELARRRRDLNAAAGQLAEATGDETSMRQTVEAAASSTREALENWAGGPGKQLRDLFNLIRDRFSQLPESASDPQATHLAAFRIVTTELERLQALSEVDLTAERMLAEVQESLRQGRARLAIIENELGRDKGANQELAQALTCLLYTSRCV